MEHTTLTGARAALSEHAKKERVIRDLCKNIGVAFDPIMLVSFIVQKAEQTQLDGHTYEAYRVLAYTRPTGHFEAHAVIGFRGITFGDTQQEALELAIKL